MFLTNRSLLALWSAILFLSFFVIFMVIITQEQEEFLPWATVLELIFLFSMATIQAEIERAIQRQMKNDSVQKSPEQSLLLRLLKALLYIIFGIGFLFVMAIFLGIFQLILFSLKEMSASLFLIVLNLFAVAHMLFTLRAQRRVSPEKLKNSD